VCSGLSPEGAPDSLGDMRRHGGERDGYTKRGALLHDRMLMTRRDRLRPVDLAQPLRGCERSLMPRTKSPSKNRGLPVEPWFESFRDELGAVAVVDPSWPTTAGAMLHEALSDAGAEQFLYPLAAMRLRQFGRRRATGQGFRDEVFWARSEWEMVDVSYGLAKPFDVDSDAAWRVVRTALLGTGA